MAPEHHRTEHGENPHTFAPAATYPSRRQVLSGAAAGVALSALAGAETLSPRRAMAADSRSPAGQATPPTSADLVETGALQRRWMSLPESRLVVNPYDFNTNQSPVQQSTGSHVPWCIGYYAEDRAFRLPDLVTLYRKPDGRSGAVVPAWVDGFESLSDEWTLDPGVEATVTDGQLQLNLDATSANWWGSIQRWVEVDLDASPYLQVSVTELADAWALRVNDGGADITVQGDTNDKGLFTYDLAKATGWTGRKRFRIRLVVAIWEMPARFDFIRIIGVDSVLEGAEAVSTAWMPHELPTEASYADGTTVSLRDYFHDGNSVVRTVDFELSDHEESRWTLAGRYVGDVAWNADDKTVTVLTQPFSYAVALPDVATYTVEYYPALPELLSNTGAVDSATDGYWSVDSAVPGRRSQAIAVGFATTAEGADVAVQRAVAAKRRSPGGSRRSRKFWDAFLAGTVPHPRSFAIADVPDKDVTAEQIRHSYYTAWIFLHSNVLPPMPETGYDYPQLPTGKPSMWMFGASGAAASASWESLLAMQFYAYVNPSLAWAAFRGLMSLVDEEGILGGESLPSRKAQTAKVLYHLTGDRESLRGVYPALKRYLIWRKANPRWIHGDHDNPNEKDANFVVSVIIDMADARDIAEILGMPQDVTFWDAEREDLFEDYLRWFWETPTSEPVEYYYTDTGQRDPGGTLWISGGTHIDLWEDGSPHLAGLVRRLAGEFNPDSSFGQLSQPKYPDISYTVYGLLELGLRELAAQLANVCIRDVTRANMFAEVYFEWDFPTPLGVRPSFFGAGSVIDLVWMNNGYRMDQGWPHFVSLAATPGGISNLAIRDRTLNVKIDPAESAVELSGSLVRSTGACRTLDVPPGTTTSLPRTCATSGA